MEKKSRGMRECHTHKEPRRGVKSGQKNKSERGLKKSKGLCCSLPLGVVRESQLDAHVRRRRRKSRGGVKVDSDEPESLSCLVLDDI